MAELVVRGYERVHVQPASVRGAPLKTVAYRARIAPINQYHFLIEGLTRGEHFFGVHPHTLKLSRHRRSSGFVDCAQRGSVAVRQGRAPRAQHGCWRMMLVMDEGGMLERAAAAPRRSISEACVCVSSASLRLLWACSTGTGVAQGRDGCAPHRSSKTAWNHRHCLGTPGHLDTWTPGHLDTNLDTVRPGRVTAGHCSAADKSPHQPMFLGPRALSDARCS